MLYGRENCHGGDIYAGDVRLDFSASVSPLGTPKSVIDALTRVLPELYHYPDPRCRALVQAIAKFERVPQERILCGAGASELIYTYCEAVRPKRAMVLAPTFSEYAIALQRTGCEIVRHTLAAEQNFDLQEDLLPRLSREGIDALFLCNPNNPTGRLIQGELLEKILLRCRERNIALFVDECFLSLSDGANDLTPFLPDVPQLFILKAFTKAFLAENRALIRAERPRLEEELRKLGFWVCPSQVNYILFHGAPDLHEKLMRRGMAIRNCANFEGLAPGWYRVAVRRREENEQLIAAIKSVAEE